MCAGCNGIRPGVPITCLGDHGWCVADEYDSEKSKLYASGMWNDASEKAQDKALGILYDLVNDQASDKQTAAAAKLGTEKYLLYTLALSKADEEGNNNGSSSMEEVYAAIKSMHTTPAKEHEIWTEIAGYSEKNYQKYFKSQS